MVNQRRGRLFVVSGPSGSGKSSLCAALLKQCPDLQLSISCTTRPPRPGEEDSVQYHFLSRELFEGEVESGAFLEWANVHGNLYGTRRRDVESALASGKDILLEIDWQGAAQVAERVEDAYRIFILPPSIEELRVRLTARGQDADEVVQRRVAAAESEMAHAHEAHSQLVNDDFDQALEKLHTLYSNNRS
ncbi:MAG TPA: guanylate kinase [Mariprofundaceae bacterium]|nr:guanylate kinase [Mariprofundaceae bacterium]